MSDLPIIALVVLATFVALSTLAVLARRAKASPPSAVPATCTAGSAAPERPAASAEARPRIDSVTAASTACLKLAFGVMHGDETISGKHARVLDSVGAAIGPSLLQRDYFPRRPLQLPKLLKTLNDGEASCRELAQLILEDPALTSAVLQRANSPAFRTTSAPVENVDSAVMLLGTEGLRGTLAMAIMLPVFHVPRGYFDNFAAITWEQAERASAAAEETMRRRGADAFVAQILGLLSLLAHIVIFRLTMEKYREHPDTLPHAEVFITAIRAHRARIAGLIAASWTLSPASLAALAEQTSEQPGAQISALGRTTRLCALCGALATLAAHGELGEAEALAALAAQGLRAEAALPLWRAARR